jgi:hypothetical protein
MSPIMYPIIFRFDDMIVPTGDDFPKIWNFRHLRGDTFEASETIHPDARFHWMIDANGELREMRLMGKRREWARPFRHIWTFVRVRYELGEGKAITVGEFRPLLDGCRADWDKSLTPALNEFLAKYPDDAAFTKEMFLDFLNGTEEEEE